MSCVLPPRLRPGTRYRAQTGEIAGEWQRPAALVPVRPGEWAEEFDPAHDKIWIN